MNIKFNNVSYAHENKDIIYHCDITITPNTLYILTGESGIGKTTFFDVLAGFLNIKSGSITFNNEELSTLSVSQRPVNYLFQSDNLFEHLTAFENAALALNPNLKLSDKEKLRVTKMLKYCGVAAKSSEYPQTLSGGQQQRVAIARALLRERPILLLDEPFTGLDHANIKAMLTLITQYLQQEGTYAIIVSHELNHFSETHHETIGFEQSNNELHLVYR